MISTALHTGGRRWWYICPVTGKRVGKLYLPAGATHFAGRQVRTAGGRSVFGGRSPSSLKPGRINPDRSELSTIPDEQWRIGIRPPPLISLQYLAPCSFNLRHYGPMNREMGDLFGVELATQPLGRSQGAAPRSASRAGIFGAGAPNLPARRGPDTNWSEVICRGTQSTPTFNSLGIAEGASHEPSPCYALAHVLDDENSRAQAGNRAVLG